MAWFRGITVFIMTLFCVLMLYKHTDISRQPASNKSSSCKEIIQDFIDLDTYLTSAEIEIVKDYQGLGYREVNLYLRGDDNYNGLLSFADFNQQVMKEEPHLVLDYERITGEWFDNHYRLDEIDSDHYVIESLRDIKEEMLDKLKKKYSRKVNQLKRALKKLPPTERRLYRALKIDDETKRGRIKVRYTVGEIIEERSFLSTSKKEIGAAPGPGMITHLFVIDGKTARDISSISADEEELIFLPGTKFKVMDIRGKFIKDPKGHKDANSRGRGYKKMWRLIKENYELFGKIPEKEFKELYKKKQTPVLEIHMVEVS